MNLKKVAPKMLGQKQNWNVAKTLLFAMFFSCLVSCEDKEELAPSSSPSHPTEGVELKVKSSNVTPVPGTTLVTNEVDFSWDIEGRYFWLDVGTYHGGTDIFSHYYGIRENTVHVTDLPSEGDLYVRIWYTGGWSVFYHDFEYTMNVGGYSMTPESGSELDTINVEFAWTHEADYYRLFVGSQVGESDLFDSNNISETNVIVPELPSGEVFVRLWLYADSTSSYHDFEYTVVSPAVTPDPDPDPNPNPNPGTIDDKTYIITRVQDNLDPDDMILFAEGLNELGYTQTARNDDVSKSDLLSYLAQPVKVLYHTGHGSEGYVSTSDYYGGLNIGDVSHVVPENTIFATCLTLKDRGWKDKFTTTTMNIMGYTNYSFDGPDDDVAENFVSEIGDGKTYLQAWYEVNNAESMLNDRWCCYHRSEPTASVVEYSANNGNSPKSLSTNFRTLASGRVMASSNLSTVVPTTSRSYMISKRQPKVSTRRDFETLTASNTSLSSAVRIAKEYISQQGSFNGATLDKAVTIKADANVIAYQVRFKRVVDGISVRGNKVNDYVSLLISDGEIVSNQSHWSSITSLKSASVAVNVKDVDAILNMAATRLASMYKGDVLKIVEANYCLGYKEDASGNVSLIPAYEFVSEDGAGIVVDALTGDVL